MKKFPNPRSGAMMVIALTALVAASHLVLAATPTQAATPGNTGITSNIGTVNINTATTSELMTLPGIGKVKADAIVQQRSVKKFTTVDDLQSVRGIGPKLLEQLRSHLRVDGAAAAKPAAKRSPATTSSSGRGIPTTGAPA